MTNLLTRRHALTCIAAAMMAAFNPPARVTTFELDDWQGSWNSSFSVGTAVRAGHRDTRLYGQANGALIGLTDGSGANTIDEGNLNYDKGDRFTTLFKLISEVELKKGDLGLLVRGKAWYDEALKDESVRFGNQGNGYNGYDLSTNALGSRRALSDKGFERLNRFSGLYLLDAYVYDTFEVAGKPLQIRVGNQVINWGESLFVQGLNVINPIDVPSFRKPGAQLKEVFLPVPALQMSQSLGAYGGIEAFWQWEWKNTPIEASCGNYWAVANSQITGGSPGVCDNAVALPGYSGPQGVAANAYIPTTTGRKAKDAGQFGLAYRFSSEALDTEFGFYGMNIHSRTPVVSVQLGSTTLSPVSSYWEYPENIKVYGVSASTNLLGWSVGAELSYHHGVPAQVDGNDLLLASLAASGGLSALNVPTGTPMGPYGAAAVAAFAGSGSLPGYTRTNKTQFQLNTVKAGNGVLGAGQYIFIAEAAVQLNDLPDYRNDPTALRYNRAFIFGPGSSVAYGGNTCAAGLNVNVQGCDNDGYVSRKSGGYRMRMELTYNRLIPGVTVYPSLFVSHDVFGYSVDSQFIKGRMAVTPAVKLTYAKTYSLELGAVFYNRNAKYDPLRDRNFVFATAGITF